MLREKLFRYSIDTFNGRFISGWCFHRLKKIQPVTIRIVADSRFLGSVSNSVYRKDLKKKRMHPTGVCGFIFDFPQDFDPQNHAFLSFYSGTDSIPFVRISCRDVTLLQPESAKSIFFMHIPKTAGTSFNAFARMCYSHTEYALHIERLAPEERAKCIGNRKYLAGHLPIREIDDNLDVSTYELYSILRNPYDHLHSHLNYVINVHTEADLEIHYGYKHNDTIKKMAGRISRINLKNDLEIKEFVDHLETFECDFFDNIQTRYFLDYRPEKVCSADLKNAKKCIDRFRLVGLTEQYGGFLNQFCKNMGLPRQEQRERANTSDYYQLFDHSRQTTRTALSPLVEVDLALYEYVAERFWKGNGEDYSRDH